MGGGGGQGGNYVLVVKFTGGGLCPSCKIHGGGGDYVHLYKNEQGGFCPGGGGLCRCPILCTLTFDLLETTICM